MALEGFPLDHLSNVYNLAGPLQSAPQLFNKDISEALDDTRKTFPELGESVAHYNFHGGQYDLQVDEDAARMDMLKGWSKCKECFYNLKTTHMKNAY